MAIPRYFTRSQTLRLAGLQLSITLFVVAIASDTAWLMWVSGVITVGTGLACFGWPRLERWLLTHCSANATFWRAREHHRAGRTDEAMRGFEDFARTHPGDPSPLIWQAILLASQYRYWDAIRFLNRSIEIKPLGDAYSRRGAIRVDLGDLEGAQDDLRKAILLEPDPYYPKATIAIGILRARRISEAVQILEPMRNTRPGLAVLAYLAEAYRLERRVDDEAKVCKEILKLALNGEPGHERACLIGHKALALIRLQRLEEAQNVLAIALEKHPGDVHILVALADLQNATGDSDGLFATLTSLITRLPAGVAVELMHPDFTANLHEVRFRRLLAWALGAQRAACERLRSAHAEKEWPAQG